MTEIIERNKHWLVKSKFGSYTFNNKQSAEQLTELESLQNNKTDNTNIQKQLIQLKLTTNILSDEIDKLQDMIK